MKNISKEETTEYLLKTMEVYFNNTPSQINCDITERGTIKTDNGDGSYVVTIHKCDFTIKARAGLTLEIGNVVYVRYVKGNMSEMFIDCVVP